ncbi:septal ring lytic transglycosylase RlpA family protein [Hyphomicrobium sp.]|uniref:septal ring lytic transglycosylase RlpA family protein n=1 Tax=Hyphomicrobium sp. TaxID=82 RepID=UPI002C12234A|nr:septal ring lytic transglycosylase RlpA family protein [Hyphomicrobium sp.]HRN87189.1 septal ring lytic transglycosylase RlpA family protein [Hyphomicrobium sp.]HRQ25811.1 septal ring lytic transglycosylase RlpA family protein [Hyphomicrobium sp.]
MSRIHGQGAAAPGPTGSIASAALSRSARTVAALAASAAVAATAMGGCASSQSSVSSGLAPGSGASSKSASKALFPESEWGVSASRRVVGPGERIPKGGGHYKVGQPYQVGGRWYHPREQPDYDRVGIASWYGPKFHGRKTANGEIFDMYALTAAHPTLPMPSYAYVTNPSNGRTVLVRVNDRGPYVGDRMIDLSRETARVLGLKSGGTGRVRVQYAGPAPLDGDDSRERQFLASRAWNTGNGRDVAAVEQAVSAHEWANYEARAPRRPAGRMRTAQNAGPAYAPASGMSGAWSPHAHRERIAAR